MKPISASFEKFSRNGSSAAAAEVEIIIWYEDNKIDQRPGGTFNWKRNKQTYRRKKLFGHGMIYSYRSFYETAELLFFHPSSNLKRRRAVMPPDLAVKLQKEVGFHAHQS